MNANEDANEEAGAYRISYGHFITLERRKKTSNKHKLKRKKGKYSWLFFKKLIYAIQHDDEFDIREQMFTKVVS